MRIVYLCPDLGIPLNGTKGAAVHVRSMVHALSRAGHEVVVVAATGCTGAVEVPVMPLRLSGLAQEIAGRTTDVRTGRALSHLLANVAVETALTELAAWFAPHVIYERYSPFSAAGGLVAQRLGVPHILEVNAPLAWEGAHYRKQALAEAADALEQAAFGATTRLIAVSEELKTILAAQGVSPAKIAVVPNGVDLERFTPDGPRWTAARPDQVVIGFVGSLRPWHGVELLARSFRQAAAVRDDLHLLVVGDGPEARHIDRLAADLPGRVTRAAAVPHDEVPRLLRGMDVAVAPYMALERFYYSPLKVLEYMAAGRPIVASAQGQVADLLRHGETALLVPPGDTDALTAAMLQLAAGPELRGLLGAAARRAAQRHGWDVRAVELVDHVRAAA
jgi:glycosyltransferase involved in cell wall biosynthesis